MSHLAGETLVAFVDGEMEPLAERRATRHLESCTVCSTTAAEFDGTCALFAGALQWLDDDEPAAWASLGPAPEVVRTRVARPAAPRTPVATGGSAPVRAGDVHVRPPGRALRWAAAVTLLAGTAAAAVMAPGLVTRVRTALRPADTGPAPAAVDATGAVAVSPVNGAVDILLMGAAEGTRVRIALHDLDDVLVDYTAAVPPRFIARDGSVSLDLGGNAATLRITVPRTLRTGRIVIDGTVAAVLTQGRVVSVRGDPGIIIDADSAGG